MPYRTFFVVLLLLALMGCVSSTSRQPKARPHYTMGLSFLQSQNPTMALREFLKAVDENPDDPQIHAGLARAYQLKKAYLLAEQHYLKALSLSDNDPTYQNNLAALYISMERWDQAIDYFDKASANLLFMRPELALMGTGYAYYRKGDYPTALRAYKEALSIAPRLAVLQFHIAETYAATSRVKLALASYEKALFYDSTYSEARYQYAVLLLKENKVELAKEMLATIVEQAPLSDWGSKATEFLEVLK